MATKTSTTIVLWHEILCAVGKLILIRLQKSSIDVASKTVRLIADMRKKKKLIVGIENTKIVKTKCMLCVVGLIACATTKENVIILLFLHSSKIKQNKTKLVENKHRAQNCCLTKKFKKI